MRMIDIVTAAEYRYRAHARTFARSYQRRHPGTRYRLYRVPFGWRVDLLLEVE